MADSSTRPPCKQERIPEWALSIETTVKEGLDELITAAEAQFRKDIESRPDMSQAEYNLLRADFLKTKSDLHNMAMEQAQAELERELAAIRLNWRNGEPLPKEWEDQLRDEQQSIMDSLKAAKDKNTAMQQGHARAGSSGGTVSGPNVHRLASVGPNYRPRPPSSNASSAQQRPLRWIPPTSREGDAQPPVSRNVTGWRSSASASRSIASSSSAPLQRSVTVGPSSARRAYPPPSVVTVTDSEDEDLLRPSLRAQEARKADQANERSATGETRRQESAEMDRPLAEAERNDTHRQEETRLAAKTTELERLQKALRTKEQALRGRAAELDRMERENRVRMGAAESEQKQREAPAQTSPHDEKAGLTYTNQFSEGSSSSRAPLKAAVPNPTDVSFPPASWAYLKDRCPAVPTSEHFGTRDNDVSSDESESTVNDTDSDEGEVEAARVVFELAESGEEEARRELEAAENALLLAAAAFEQAVRREDAAKLGLKTAEEATRLAKLDLQEAMRRREENQRIMNRSSHVSMEALLRREEELDRLARRRSAKEEELKRRSLEMRLKEREIELMQMQEEQLRHEEELRRREDLLLKRRLAQ